MRWAPELALSWLHPTNSELGYIGECIAARHLLRRGERIVARRLRTRAAEIDLVVRKEGRHACVEVKTGRVPDSLATESALWSGPGARLDRAQLNRLRRAARLLERELGSEVRVDLVEVCLDPSGRLKRVRVHRDLRHPIGWTRASRLL